MKRGFFYQNTKILYFLPLITKSIIHLKYKVNIAKLPDLRKDASSVGLLHHNCRLSHGVISYPPRISLS